ncbi:DUF5134 domain-containing protein [Streptacidiphilus sp. ASG 303]|uniref:DUF5134 domain-containing protein n=1 Tax=Streptacidiphilus sp. ASG 303 TaxID=2896847 RepID=UPI001E2D222E|nr:DUF5134 domain-containing protein [Streptacidiphilus sp. ASG 303]MCD0483809.1 DUF5134 domain-containing protein [Streptacidiphilus sp. ASG 303]
MHGAPLLGWLLAALTGAAGLNCLVRLCTGAARGGCAPGAAAAGPAAPPGRAGDRESDAAEALMGLGMAAMALPPARHAGLPPAAWAAAFGLVAAWFATAALRRARVRERAHRLHHAVGAGAMVYTAAAMAGGAGHGAAHAVHTAHPGTAGGPPLPLLGGLLLLYFGGYALWAGGRLLRPAVAAGAPAVPGGAPAAHAPGLAGACRLVMGIGMFAMLLTG